jgi:ParB-like chromosome segregation protein Spo0J
LLWHDNKALAEDLHLRGQRDPIIIMPANNAAGLPANTILDGHRRIEAMLANGQTEADVLVREDLKDADEQTVTAAFLGFNLLRRQLHPLDKARVVQQLFVAKAGVPLNDLDMWKRGELRDRIGESLGMSGRNLDRYLRVLETPLEIQHAVRDRRLKLVPASRIALLSCQDQQQIVQRIAGLADPKEIDRVVAEFIELNPVMISQKSGESPASAFTGPSSSMGATTPSKRIADMSVRV